MKDLKFHYHEIDGKKIGVAVLSENGLPDFTIKIEGKDYWMSGEPNYDDSRNLNNRYGTIVYLKSFRTNEGIINPNNLDIAVSAVSSFLITKDPYSFVKFE